MSYTVQLARQAATYFDRLPRNVQERILKRLADMAADPLGKSSKPLKDPEGRRSARVGDWRIIFTVDEAKSLVSVSTILPRGQVYREL